MDLTKEEGKSQNRKRAFPETDLSEWEITCKEFCPRKGKQRDDNDKKSRHQASKPKKLPPRICIRTCVIGCPSTSGSRMITPSICTTGTNNCSPLPDARVVDGIG
jgi:hypothetical protein